MDNALIPMNQSTQLERLDFEALMLRFLAGINVRPISKESYRRNLRPFFKWITSNGMAPINEGTIRAYKEYLRDAGKSGVTAANYMSAVRKFFRWAESIGLCPNYARDVKSRTPSRRHRKDPLTVGQIRQLLASVDRSTLMGLRDFCLLSLLVRTGIRTIELVRADIGDIRMKSDAMVLWVHGKGRQDKSEEFAVLTPDCLAPISEYLSARGNLQTGEPLFASCSSRELGTRLSTRTIRRIIKGYLRTIGIDGPRWTTHSLRHSAISLALSGGASPVEVRDMARHANLATTQMYAQELDRLGKAAEKKIEEMLREPAAVNSITE